MLVCGDNLRPFLRGMHTKKKKRNLACQCHCSFNLWLVIVVEELRRRQCCMWAEHIWFVESKKEGKVEASSPSLWLYICEFFKTNKYYIISPCFCTWLYPKKLFHCLWWNVRSVFFAQFRMKTRQKRLRWGRCQSDAISFLFIHTNYQPVIGPESEQTKFSHILDLLVHPFQGY